MIKMNTKKDSIKPWPKVRALKDYEWKRDLDEDIQDESRRRNIAAVFARIEKDVEWYAPQFSVYNPAGYYDEAIFQEENDVKEFRVARRLVRQLKIGDHVVLEVGGCCTILSPPKLTRERT